MGKKRVSRKDSRENRLLTEITNNLTAESVIRVRLLADDMGNYF